ncbi:nucleotidyltransferase domain-containing protein [Bacillus sp. B15-48]|uniref:type VII toxin-antitoxin system MntA family adenylyltransferase antitoxin n=1 Tax=Bacillus sp. B15-48 TaxID=1548601 RepID=UPI00193F31E4|nr:nucleotidyltransferase domain-containing protein [Bacillus sp. B15-48]MBM4764856.1 nucleotidyltransferase domain-containing protein [Bacillus sp. B15-48]
MSESLEKIIIDVLCEKFTPFLILIFGSTVKGTQHSESDIDIAFAHEEKELDKYEVFLTAQDLASKLKREVDLVDLNQVSTVFQAQIVSTGRVIYCTDEQKRAQFELKTLKMYAKLNEERSPILKKIDESGRIYEK